MSRFDDLNEEFEDVSHEEADDTGRVGRKVQAFEVSVDTGCTTNRGPTYPFWGLTGECGEVVKKAWRKHDKDWFENVDHEKLKDELGDVLWYVTRCAQVMGVSLTDIMDINMKKLEARRAAKNGD